MKIYVIAGREWLMKPLTLRQKKLIAASGRVLRAAFLDTAKAQLLEDTSVMLQQLYEAGCKVDEIVLGEDFPRFLSTILTPKDAVWKKEFREEHAALMEEMTGDVQAEVLRDFFSAQMNGMRPRPDSSIPSDSGSSAARRLLP